MSTSADSPSRGQEQSEPRWLSPAETRAWLAFWWAMQLVDATVDRDLQGRSGLSHGEYQILATLSIAPERRLRMGALAEVVVVSRSRLTYQVTHLEKAGLVRREDDLGDKRGTVCVLTERGMGELRAAAPGHVACVRRVFFDVLTPEQVAVLGDALGAVTDHLIAEAGPGAMTFLAALRAGMRDDA